MENPDSSTRLPFVPGDVLFHLPESTRDTDIIGDLTQLVEDWGGSVPLADPDEGSRNLDAPVQEELPLRVLRATFAPATASEEFARLLALSNELNDRQPEVSTLPNWLVGGAGGGPGGGSGAGPGTRPLPAEFAALPLDDALVGPLRDAADAVKQPVRLVFFDAWNGDHDETRDFLSHRPLLHALNDYCWDLNPLSGLTPLPNHGRAHQPADPFPMPDHGIFAAHLASSVIEDQRLRLHDAVAARVASGFTLPTGYITIEGWRVLDENGVGDSETLIRALDALTASIQPGEHVVVNLSLVVTIPDVPTQNCRQPNLWRHEWGAVAPEPFVNRLPHNLHASEQRLDVAILRAVQRLREAGALIVAAAGNSSLGPGERRTASFPAAYDETLCVTAAAYDGTTEAWYANLATPGGVALYAGDVSPTQTLDLDHPLIGPFTNSEVPIHGHPDPANHDGAVAWAGTSFATPLASGLACLLWAASPGANADAICDALRGLADAAIPRLDFPTTPYIRLLQY